MENEKHSIIADMIALAKADNHIDERERDFIMAIAKRLGVYEAEVSTIFEQEYTPKAYATELERITQFHRLILLMNVDQKTQDVEITAIRNYGLRLGIRQEAVSQILGEMGDYEHSMIPSERLVQIFKRFYN